MDHDFRNRAIPATNDDGNLPVKRNRSLRRLFPGKHGVSASSTSSSTSSTSTLPPRLPSAPRSQPPISYNDRNRVAPQRPHSQRSASNDSYHNKTSPAPYLHNIRPVPSEAARLRSLNSGQQSPINSESRPRQDITPQLENFSRPRKISLKGGEEPPKPPLNPSSTFPLQNRSEAPSYTPRPEFVRERGFSASSSLSNTFAPSRPLRNSISIPDLIPADRQRDVSNNSTTSRNGMGYGSRDDNLPSHYREPIIRPNPLGEEVRESFRSVQTTGTTGTGTTWRTGTTATTWTASSFLDASGTERSSVLSKSSSATSINGRDQIDDFLDMYEDGFTSETEEENLPRPPTIRSFQSENSGQTRIPEPASNNNNDLQVPQPQFSNLIIRDSAEIFRVCKTYADPFHEGADNARGSSATTQPYQSSQRPPTGLSRRPSRRDQTQTPSSVFDNTRDRYGFKKKSQHVSLPDYEAWSAEYADHVARRRRKWIRLMQECGLDVENPTMFPPKSSKTKRFIRKGIPPDWRGEAWFWYAGGPAILAQHPGLYAELVSRAANGRVSATDEELIERDLNRTFPDNILFKPDAVPLPPGADSSAASVSAEAEAETPMLQSLRRVLQATSIHNPKIGYCQSLNFLAGLLLLFLDEERAFWMLDIITKTYLPGTHEVSLEGANVDLGVLMSCIRESMPGVWAKIGGELDGTGAVAEERRGAAPTMRLPPITLCCTAWFMSCFIGTLPIETTLRVWDAFFYEGSKTLFRIALAVFKVGEAEIRAVSDPMEIFQVVQTIPRRLVDANALMGACFRRRNGFGHLSQETIEERRRERRRGYADEREGRRPESKRGNVFATMRGRR